MGRTTTTGPMIQMEFGLEDMQALQEQRFDHPHPWVRRKLEAVYLKSQNLSHEGICQMCGIGGNTLRRYLREYATGCGRRWERRGNWPVGKSGRQKREGVDCKNSESRALAPLPHSRRSHLLDGSRRVAKIATMLLCAASGIDLWNGVRTTRSGSSVNT